MIAKLQEKLLQMFEGPMIMIRDLLETHRQKTGQLPSFYFYQLSRIVPMPAYELLILRGSSGAREILLTQRDADDPHWPSAWHFPGTIVRNGDSAETIWKRLAAEIGAESLPGTPKLFEADITNNERGWGTHTFWTLEWPGGEPATGKFFPLTALPTPIIPHQAKQLERYRERLDKAA